MPTPLAAEKLPTTSYVVLGLLSLQDEMSGYDLKQAADRTIAHFYWSPARNQIYAELRRLAAHEYVTERTVQQARRPDKRLYRLTAEGEAALRQWLEDTAAEPLVFKSMFLLKFFFGSHVSHETTLRRLEAYRRSTETFIEKCEMKEAHLRDRDDMRFAYLTLRHGLDTARARLAWAEEALERLRS